MTQRGWKIFIVLSLVISIIFILFNWRWTTGFVLGSAASVLAYKNTEYYVDQTISARMPAGTVFHMMLNYIIWTIVLIVCALLPQFLNVLCCALGLFTVRTALIIDSLWRKEK